MTKIIFIVLVFFVSSNLFAQNLSRSDSKPPIDVTAINKWPSLENPGISNDGNTVFYTIQNQPVGSNTLIIKSITDNWKKEIVGASPLLFTEDCKKAIFQGHDTLFFLTLGTEKQTFIPNIGSVKWSRSAKEDWIAYQLKNSDRELILQNLVTEKEQHFVSVVDYSLDNNGNVLLIKTETKQDSVTSFALEWVGLSDGKVSTIWPAEPASGQGTTLGQFNFDIASSQLAFIVEKKEGTGSINTIWYYKSGMDKAVMRVNNQSPGMYPGLSIAGSGLEFSKNGSWIFFQLQEPTDNRKPKPDAVKVDVWRYRDVLLQSEQLTELESRKYDAALNVVAGPVTRITQGDEKIINGGGNYIVIEDNKAGTKFWWNRPLASFYLYSLTERARKVLKEGSKTIGYSLSVSPMGNYIIYWDQMLNQYFSYDIITGKVHNISQAIRVRLDNEYLSGESRHEPIVGVAGWLEKDAALLIYDNYDIWQIDPSGSTPPINVTNGYGRSHHIKFRLVDEPESTHVVLKSKESLLLTAFNPLSKDNGFFRKTLGEKGNPEFLTMGTYFLYIVDSQVPRGLPGVATIKPLKARDANSWIVERMSASQAPNFFLTKDFKTYTAISDLQPQKNYNWLTTELVNWRQLDGTVSQGVLYKPENFDPHKKYPVLFEYYDQTSFSLHAYLPPELTQSYINIPWFVSHGYLVFRPDIHFSIANTSGRTNGMNTYNAVVSAAQYISKLPYVDARKMGINGHSFGGQLTNYLVTHTHLFAAAAESAGTSDMVSTYLTVTWPLGSNGGDRQNITEISQGRMGASLWERPDLYLSASPVLRADRVTTPLLIMHNKADSAVPWGQAVEMYMALRRLEKKVWMLQYDNEGHILNAKKAAADYTIRLNQFFDYYLKGAPPPMWMTRGVPANLKGIETGLEQDTSGKQP